MAEPVGDLVVDLSLDAARFDEQMARVRRHFSGTESDAKKTAAVVEQSLSRQALAAQKAGISVGQYKAAMRMLPAQFTDVATQLAGGQSPWLILLQQGGQVKDSFGGMIPMFRGLAGVITLPMVGATSLAVATGALAYAWYQGNSTLSDFNKTLVLSGNQSGLTADRMLVLSRAGQAAGLTFNQTSESLSALVKAGVSGEAQIASISQSVARFSSASGVVVDKVAEAFGKLTTDPTSGLTAMARQFHNVTAEQIAYVAQLQRSGDEAGALQAANEAATKGFDDQTRRLKENMGTLETWADRTARAFKSMWDAVLDIGRPDTAQEMLIKAEAAFKKADDIWNLRKDDYFVNDEARARYWDDREKARLALEAARKKAEQQTQQDKNAQQQSDTEASRLKYTEEAQKAYERLQTPLEKYTARQEELNKALKDGKILQADYNTLMAAAKKDYEATLKKPKQSGVKVSAGDRQEDSAHAALLTLQAELRTLEKHAGANEKISQQRRDLWKAESQFAVLEEVAQRRQLSAQEKSLLAHKDETLEYKRQLAALGDKVTYQERLNALAQQADKFAQQQRAKRAAIDAKSRGLTDRQAEREATEQRLKEQYGDNPLALNNVMSEQKKTWAAEDQLRGSWMAGLRSGWSEWKESATDSMSQVKSAATQTFDGIAQNMAAMLTGSEQNWRSFTRSVLSMMTEILLKQAMVGIVGSIGSAIGGAVGGGASASGGTAIQAAAAKFHFATGGFTGTGGKYEPAGIVHRGEFVFTKEATSRIGVGNLYRLMRGYLGTALYWIAASINIKPGHDYYFYVRSVNTVGKSTFVEAVGRASDDAEGYLDFFKGLITESHLGKELLEKVDLTEDNASKLEQFSKEWKDANDKWNAMWGVKIEQTEDGKHYVAGLGLSMEDTEEGKLSQFLVAANRIAFIDPSNGNTRPMFVGQGDQIFMNDVFLKRLTAPTITSGGNPPAFSLTPDGRLTAKNADISGNVNANSGTLNNVTINENCRVLGKLSANQIEGDLVKTVGKAFPRDSRAPERWPSGTITVRVYDDQPFDRQIVIPAVAFSGAKHEKEHTDIYSSCRLIVRKNGAEIYNRTALDNTLIYSGVIDMPAGHGHMTLEFSVSAWLVNNWYPTASISDLLVVVMKKATAGITIS